MWIIKLPDFSEVNIIGLENKMEILYFYKLWALP